MTRESSTGKVRCGGTCGGEGLLSTQGQTLWSSCIPPAFTSPTSFSRTHPSGTSILFTASKRTFYYLKIFTCGDLISAFTVSVVLETEFLFSQPCTKIPRANKIGILNKVHGQKSRILNHCYQNWTMFGSNPYYLLVK